MTTPQQIDLCLPLQNGTTASSIACVYICSMIIKSDGTVHGTGYNDQGQLGDNTITDRHGVYRFKWHNSRQFK